MQKLGWEVRIDVTMAEMGNFRWLTVGPADPYGIDSGFRDPSGNSLRLTQVRDLAAL